LREADVMGVRRTPLAQQAGLQRDELEVLAIATPSRFAQCEGALVDARRTRFLVVVLVQRRECRHFREECMLDQVGVSGRESIFQPQRSESPSGCFFGRSMSRQIAQKFITQGRRLFGRQNGRRGSDGTRASI
jgi:hypothetical protein